MRRSLRPDGGSYPRPRRIDSARAAVVTLRQVRVAVSRRSCGAPERERDEAAVVGKRHGNIQTGRSTEHGRRTTGDPQAGRIEVEGLGQRVHRRGSNPDSWIAAGRLDACDQAPRCPRCGRDGMDERALRPYLESEGRVPMTDLAPAVRPLLSRRLLEFDLERTRREDGVRIEPSESLVAALLRGPQRPVKAVTHGTRRERAPLRAGEDPLGPPSMQGVELRLRVVEVDDVVADAQDGRPSKYSRSMSASSRTTCVARSREARGPRSSVRGSTTRSAIVKVSPRAGKFDHVRCASPRA